MDDAPRRRLHPWTWIQWIVIAGFAVLSIASLFDVSLAWMSIGFAGLLTLAVGIIELVAPAWFLESRRRYLNDAPAWRRRVQKVSTRSVLDLLRARSVS
jgi:hypothetical protein